MIKCDLCGRFISYQDLQDDKAHHIMITPDSHRSSEEWETTCAKCLKREELYCKQSNYSQGLPL